MILPTKLLPQKLIATLVAIAVVVCGVFQTGLRAEEGPNDPNNIWYRAFLLVEAARKALTT